MLPRSREAAVPVSHAADGKQNALQNGPSVHFANGPASSVSTCPGINRIELAGWIGSRGEPRRTGYKILSPRSASLSVYSYLINLDSSLTTPTSPTSDGAAIRNHAPGRRSEQDASISSPAADTTSQLSQVRNLYQKSQRWPGLPSEPEPEPSREVLQHALNVYREEVHLQPLPLFSLQSLPKRLAEASPCLRWSFLSLCLSLSPALPVGTDSDAGQRYSRSGHQAVLELASEGTATLEVLEALCLLTLSDMIEGKPARAWMTIGMASRLQAFRSLSRPELRDAYDDEERKSRCYWSILILEKAFVSQPGTTGKAGTAPSYPPSPPFPIPLPSDTNRVQVAGNIEHGREDSGLLECEIELIRLWGDIGSYLHELRQGKTESQWLPESSHTRLILRMYGCEELLLPGNLLRNVAFRHRSASELLKHREYWTVWASVQVAFHALRAVLNHPFLHLVTTHDSTRAPTPHSFLQQTVDTALYNAGWVARLLKMFDSLPFEISNPVLGHMVAGTATVLWVFQFARDAEVSRKAKQDLDSCARFMERLSIDWPHIAQKVSLLHDLQARVQTSRNESNGESTIVTFQPSVLLALLDPSVSGMAPVDSHPTADHNVDHAAATATSMRLNTQFVHPLVENQEERPLQLDGDPDIEIFQGVNGACSTFPDDFFSHFTLDDNEWLLTVP
ncbi:hypothetical protein LTR20_009927 [Exophiala xenobiotica]|nr:hypothetical protein LTS13_004163 [Exophiala xenobiotica]KAK5455541.1 hypothetical protein LTR20_009927 [Exophiala xenobiotica]